MAGVDIAITMVGEPRARVRMRVRLKPSFDSGCVRANAFVTEIREPIDASTPGLGSRVRRAGARRDISSSCCKPARRLATSSLPAGRRSDAPDHLRYSLPCLPHAVSVQSLLDEDDQVFRAGVVRRAVKQIHTVNQNIRWRGHLLVLVLRNQRLPCVQARSERALGFSQNHAGRVDDFSGLLPKISLHGCESIRYDSPCESHEST